MSKPDTSENELYELCKEVYKLTKWDNYCEYWSFGGEYTVNKDLMTSIEVQTAIIPLYTSDYLLEKLPPTVIARGKAFSTATRIAATSKQLVGAEADTPLKSLLKLTLALHEAGELK